MDGQTSQPGQYHLIISTWNDTTSEDHWQKYAPPFSGNISRNFDFTKGKK